MRNQAYINEKIQLAYKTSIIPLILSDLQLNFKGLEPVLSQLESIINLIFLKSLCDADHLNRASLHMAFSGSSGTGKSSLAEKIGQILRDLNYLTKGHLISVSREDLVGEYIGHTAPKTKEILQKAQGGILFIDEASQLYKANNEKDYGGEAIEIILQVMENHRNDLALIFSDEKKKLSHFFEANPGISSRVGHHINFPDYRLADLECIFSLRLKKEGKFFLNNEDQSILIESILLSELNKLQNFATYANIRSLESLIHKLLTYQAERLYSEIFLEKSNLSAKRILQIQYLDFIPILNENT